METTSAPKGWNPEFENLLEALIEEGRRQKREGEMREHLALLNQMYYSVHFPLPLSVIRTEVY